MKDKAEINILGISCFYHDSAAVLIRGDEIMSAVQEERFTRKKFDNRFPVSSIQYCLEESRISPEDIDCIAFYEEPYLKLDRLFEMQTGFSPLRMIYNTKRISDWIEKKFYVEDYIDDLLPDFKGEICFFPHHLSHAASAYYPSPFSKAAILSVDAVGEWACSSIAIGDGKEVRILQEQRFPHSVGLLYSAFTQYIGFKVDSGEYKLMGLAPYGNPVYVERIKERLVKIHNDGSIELNTDYFDFMTGRNMVNEKFHSLFEGKPRLTQEPITQKEMDVACSIQKVTEEILLKMVDYAIDLTGVKNLCLAGGVALNCVANGKILKSGIVDNLWVQPASGDSGGALGAALLAAYGRYEQDRVVDDISDRQKRSLLGPKFANDKIEEILEVYGFTYQRLEEMRWSEEIASILNKGNVVGLFHGRMEYGPRALGNRSILGDPRLTDMQRKMNLKIKFRESFRPFAPMILEERKREWFDINIESPYMLLVADIKEDRKIDIEKEEEILWGIDKLNVLRSDIPAVTHVDYSARIQTISEDNKKVYDILSSFEKLTGCPVLINTSFNIRGEPIVCSPLDALKCFMNTGIDVLILEGYILFKDQQGDILKDNNFKLSFEPD